MTGLGVAPREVVSRGRGKHVRANSLTLRGEPPMGVVFALVMFIVCALVAVVAFARRQ
jgi:hypothetical protein